MGIATILTCCCCWFSGLLVAAAARLTSRSRSTDQFLSISQQQQPASLDTVKNSLRHSQQLLMESVHQVGSLDIFSVADPYLLLCGSGSGIPKMSRIKGVKTKEEKVHQETFN